MKPVDGSSVHIFNYVEYGHVPTKIPSIPAGPIGSNIVAPALPVGQKIQTARIAANMKTGLTAFKASTAAKMNLIRYGGGATALPSSSSYSKSMRALGVAGAALNYGASLYQYNQGEISGVKLIYDAARTRLGLSPNYIALTWYWSGIAGQHYGPSTWGWNLFSGETPLLYDNSYLRP